MLILVRHAHAGDKHLWPFGDIDRPLSERGQQQSEGLAQLLGDLPIARMVTSPYRRCRQTLVPLSSVLDMEPETSDLLAPNGEVADLDAMLQDAAAEATLFCTHGEVLTGLLDRWRKTGTVALPKQPTSTAKGASWIVEESGGSRVAHYLRPLRVLDVRSEQTEAASQ